VNLAKNTLPLKIQALRQMKRQKIVVENNAAKDNEKPGL
tara:strand:- start:6071 stop:6187 length:117 start_codon:yes stop_codon:yes gene_type:complete